MTEKLCDFYYSKEMAQEHNNYCHLVQEKPFTYAVTAGEIPLGNVPDLVLVVASVEYNEENVEYSQELLDLLKSDKFGFAYPKILK